jgi:hypothetical protein
VVGRGVSLGAPHPAAVSTTTDAHTNRANGQPLIGEE